MVQRKVPNKLGIKPIHHNLLKSDTQLVNLRPSSPQTHEKLKKIMKKPRPIKPSPPIRKTKIQPDGPAPVSKPATPPNYMKSTSSFEARKERSPKNPTTPKVSKTSSWKKLTKTPSFKPLRPSKKCSSVMLCEDSQRKTCSSTLKESKFPNYLQLSPGGTSAMKVCPYTYCSLNGHHHAPVPPLKCFLSARRRALKTQRSFEPSVKKNEEIITEPRVTPVMEEEENKDFFIEIYNKDDLESCVIDWEEGGHGSDSCNDDGKAFKLQHINGEERILKTEVESLYGELQELYYDEESVTSGAWSDGDSESDGSYQQMKIDNQIKDQYLLNYDVFEVSSSTSAAADDVIDKIKDDKITNVIEAKRDEFQRLNIPIGDQNINNQQEENNQDFAEKSEDGSDKNRTTIIFNIIQFNVSVFINGEKAEHSVADDKMETEEVNEVMVGGQTSQMVEQQIMSNEIDDENEQISSDDQHIMSNEQEECNGCEAFNQSKSNSMDFEEMNEDLSVNLKGSTRVNVKCDEDMEDLREFNPRGPNFLPEVADPDAETVDLKHQMMDERKNAKEWMVDFALQQAVTTLAPERKRKVALLVEAFEKVMPIPKYETQTRRSSKAFTNARPMQACS